LTLPVRSASADISEKIVGGIDRSRVAIRLRGEALVGAGMARLYDDRRGPDPVRLLLHREARPVGDDRAVSQPTVEDRPRRGRRGLRALLWAGVALVLAGLVMLGYVAWQLYGTNVVSARKQKQIVERTQQMWAAEPEVSVRAKPVRHRSAAALIRVPAFGRDYVLPVQQGTSDGVLAEGFGHFDGTAGPGEVGNYALAGHRVTHGEPLRNMPSLRPGDTIIVETRTRILTYRLDTDPNLLTVSFRGVWVIDPLPENPVPGGLQPAQRKGQRLITLTTCSELFHTDNRMVAFGHLVRSAPR
jgi:sortase A